MEGELDPVRDLDIISNELRLKDLELLEGAIEKMEKNALRSNDKKLKAEYVSLACVSRVLSGADAQTGVSAEDQISVGGREARHSLAGVEQPRGECLRVAGRVVVQLQSVSADRGPEQAPVHHREAGRVPRQPDGEGLHQEEEQVVRMRSF